MCYLSYFRGVIKMGIKMYKYLHKLGNSTTYRYKYIIQYGE